MAVDSLSSNGCRDIGGEKSSVDENGADDDFSDPCDVGCPRMTPEVLQECCIKGQGYREPELNEGLLLHYKGFRRVANLAPYVNVRTIWLECNGLARIEGVNMLKNLLQLYLHSNCIKRIENLDGLSSLRLLNLSNNSIERVENLETLHSLENINLAGNKIVDIEGLEGFKQCQSLRSVNMSRNYVEDGEAYVGFWQAALPEVQCLYLHQNPCSRTLKDYRRRVVSSLKALRWLDERPVWEFERVGAEAWAIGGREAEKEAQKQHVLKERDDKERSFKNFQRVSAAAAARFSAQRQAQEALNTAREEATAQMHETGDLAEGWTMLESKPVRTTSTAMEDPADQPELHEKVQSFLAARSNAADSELADDASSVVEVIDLPATEPEHEIDGQEEDQDQEPTDLPEDAAADEAEEENIAEEEFVWTSFREKRLERLVAQCRYKFDQVAPLLSDEFSCIVSAEACREQYSQLLKPGKRPSCAPPGNRARDLPDLAPAEVKEVSNWWVKQIRDGVKRKPDKADKPEKQQGRKEGAPHIFEEPELEPQLPLAGEIASSLTCAEGPITTTSGFGADSLGACLGNMDMYAAFAPPPRAVRSDLRPVVDNGADERERKEMQSCGFTAKAELGTREKISLGSELFDLD